MTKHISFAPILLAVVLFLAPVLALAQSTDYYAPGGAYCTKYPYASQCSGSSSTPTNSTQTQSSPTPTTTYPSSPKSTPTTPTYTQPAPQTYPTTYPSTTIVPCTNGAVYSILTGARCSNAPRINLIAQPISTPTTYFEGAENGFTNITAQSSGVNGGTNILNTRWAADPSPHSFRFLHDDSTADEWVVLNSSFIVTSNTQLKFQSKLGQSATGEQAVVQISANGGPWTDIGTPQNGSSNNYETVFSQKLITTANFAPYVGQNVKIRFLYRVVPGGSTFVFNFDTSGWYVDLIEVTGISVPIYEGAENGLSTVSTLSSGDNGGTNIFNTRWAADLPPHSFRFLHDDGTADEWIMINPSFVVGSNSEIRFKSKLGQSSTGEKASVQISNDNGLNWVDLWSQAGNSNNYETSFSQRVATIPSTYSGQAVRIRFLYSVIPGGSSFIFNFDTAGWYLDLLEVTNVIVGGTSPTPDINSPTTASGIVGTQFNYQITASNGPTSYAVVGTLPPGLVFSGSTISGTPTLAGTYPVTIRATNSGGTGSATLTITIAPEPISAPTISVHPQSQSANVGANVILSVTASGSGLSYQWKKGPLNVGTNSSTLNLNNIQLTDAGNYTVTVTNGGGSVTSNIATITVSPASDLIDPTMPANLSATVLSASAINLAWTASTDNVGVTGYKIFRNNSPIGTSVVASFSDTGLSANTSYSYTVLAYDAAGNESNQSVGASATTLRNPDIMAPPVPASLRVDSNSITTNSIRLIWNASVDAGPADQVVSGNVIYEMFRDGASLGTVTGTALTDTGLNANTNYTYTAMAIDGAGNPSTLSAPVVGRTAIAPPVITSSSLPNGTYGAVYGPVQLTADGPVSWGGSSFPAGISVNDAGQVSGTPTETGTFNIVLTAANQEGGSVNKIIQLVINLGPDISAPTTPTNLTTSNITNNSVKLTWDPSSEPTPAHRISSTVAGYKIYRNGAPLTTVTQTTYTDTGLSANSVYAYGVSAVDSSPLANESFRAITPQITTLPNTPNITSSLNVSTSIGASFSYTITADNSPTSFSATGLPSWLNISGSTLSGTAPILTSQQTYQVTLRASNSGGQGAAVTLNITVNLNPDTTDPLVSITSGPSNGAYVKGTITVSATANDPNTVSGQTASGISSVYFEISGCSSGGGGGGSSSGGLPLTRSVTFERSTLGCSDGPHTLKVGAVDGANNEGVSSLISIIVDNTPPVISISSPLDGSTIKDQLSFAASASDLNPVNTIWYYKDNGILVGTKNGPPYAIKFTTLSAVPSTGGKTPDGQHQLHAVARDLAGNWSTSTIVVMVDNQLPAISGSLNEPGTNNVRIKWDTSEDATGFVEYSLTDFGDPNVVIIATPVQGNSRSHNVDITNLQPNTSYFYRIKTTDIPGNTRVGATQSFTTRAISVDTTPIRERGGGGGGGGGSKKPPAQPAFGTAVNTFAYNPALTIGSTGPEVISLQDNLISRGFLVMPAGVAKGHFGPLTQAALNKYRASLATPVAPSTQLAGNTNSFSYNQSLTIGSTGSDVVSLQDNLITRGFLTMPAGVSKGYFGQLTKSALDRYLYSLASSSGSSATPTPAVNGCIAGAKFNIYNGSPCSATSVAPVPTIPTIPTIPTTAPVGYTPAPAPIAPIVETVPYSANSVFNKVLRLYSTGADVVFLQKFLNSTAYPVATGGAPGSSGFEGNTFGVATQTALKKWQISVGISENGVFGKQSITKVRELGW